MSIFSTDELNKCGLLPSGRYCDYETMSDLGTADHMLRMIIYFSCGESLVSCLREQIHLYLNKAASQSGDSLAGL